MTFNLEGARKLKLSGNSKDAMALDIAALMTWLHAACDEVERVRAMAGLAETEASVQAGLKRDYMAYMDMAAKERDEARAEGSRLREAIVEWDRCWNSDCPLEEMRAAEKELERIAGRYATMRPG